MPNNLWNYWQGGNSYPSELEGGETVEVILRGYNHRRERDRVRPNTRAARNFRWDNSGGNSDIIWWRLHDEANDPLAPGEGGWINWTPDESYRPDWCGNGLVFVRFRNGDESTLPRQVSDWHWEDDLGDNGTIVAYRLVVPEAGTSSEPDEEGWRTWSPSWDSSCPPELLDTLLEIKRTGYANASFRFGREVNWSADAFRVVERYRVITDELMLAQGYLRHTPGEPPSDLEPDREVAYILRSGDREVTRVDRLRWDELDGLTILYYKPMPLPSVWLANRGVRPPLPDGTRIEVRWDRDGETSIVRTPAYRWELDEGIAAFRILDDVPVPEGYEEYVPPPDISLEATEAMYVACREFAAAIPGIEVTKPGEREIDITVETVTIPWEGKSYNFGPFRAGITLGWSFAAVVPRIDVTGHKKHPHVGSEGSFCMGKNYEAMKDAITEARYDDFMPIFLGMLCSYNPGDRYRAIDEETTVKCRDCGARLDPDDEDNTYQCDDCGNVLCENCGYSCPECGNVLCSDCTYGCEDCGDAYCERHWNGSDGICGSCLENYTWCERCGDRYHNDDTYYCETCGNSFCDYCWGRGGNDMCENCYEDWLADEAQRLADEEAEEAEEEETESDDDEGVQLPLFTVDEIPT